MAGVVEAKWYETCPRTGGLCLPAGCNLRVHDAENVFVFYRGNQINKRPDFLNFPIAPFALISSSHQIAKSSSNQWNKMQSLPISGIKDKRSLWLLCSLASFGLWCNFFLQKEIVLLNYFCSFYFLFMSPSVQHQDYWFPSRPQARLHQL